MRRVSGLAVWACVIALSLPTRAGTVALECTEPGGAEPSAITLTYDGDAEGTLKVVASFGEFPLRAERNATEADVNGTKVTQTAIRGDGEVEVVMPAKAALEACIVSKRQSGDTDDMLGLMACQSTVATERRTASVHVEIGMHSDSPEPFVYITRGYLEVSKDYLVNGAPAGFITIQSVPPPKCTVRP